MIRSALSGGVAEEAPGAYKDVSAVVASGEHAGLKWGTEVERIFRKDVRPAIGTRKIDNIKRTDILAILNEIKDRGAGISANRALAAIRRAFSWAVAEGYLQANPALGIAPPAKEESRDRALSEPEIPTFWTGLDDARMPDGTRLALRLALVTGQRIGEV